MKDKALLSNLTSAKNLSRNLQQIIFEIRLLLVNVIQSRMETVAVRKWKDTGPSYQNESSDSVSRKLLDQFKNAFNTKYIELFHATFVTTISLNTTIHSINLINLSSFMHNPSFFPFATKWELQQSSTVHSNAFCMHSDIWEQNGGAEKVLNPWIRGIKGI